MLTAVVLLVVGENWISCCLLNSITVSVVFSSSVNPGAITFGPRVLKGSSLATLNKSNIS